MSVNVVGTLFRLLQNEEQDEEELPEQVRIGKKPIFVLKINGQIAFGQSPILTKSCKRIEVKKNHHRYHHRLHKELKHARF